MNTEENTMMKEIDRETTSSSSDWLEYYEDVKPLLGAREIGFSRIFQYLNTIKDPVIVETGMVRSENNFEGDGCSTVLFDHYVAAKGGSFITVDIDPVACKTAKRLTTYAEINEGDSVEFLSTLSGHADLLYLDSFNIHNWLDDWEASGHHLKELFAAKNIIKEGTLIVVDDNLYISNEKHSDKKFGKGRMIYELMQAIGIPTYIDGYQLGWIWEDTI